MVAPHERVPLQEFDDKSPFGDLRCPLLREQMNCEILQSQS